MADATTADPTNAVEVAALLTEAAEAGTAVEAMLSLTRSSACS